MVHKIFLSCFLICFYLNVKSQDTLKVSYSFLPSDSIDDNHICLIFNSKSLKARYRVTYNNQIAFINFGESKLKKGKKRIRKLVGKNYRAFILFKIDTSIKSAQYFDIEVVGKKNKCSKRRKYLINVYYYGYYKYLILYPSQSKKILFFLWRNRIKKRYLR